MSSSKVHQTRSENELLCAVTHGGTGASLFVWTRVAPLEQQKLWAECDTPQDEKTHHSRHRIRVVACVGERSAVINFLNMPKDESGRESAENS